MNDELKSKLEKYLPLYVAVGIDHDGNAVGTVESSWSIEMMKNTVRVWWSGTAYSLLGPMQINGKEDAEHNKLDNHFVFDLLSDDCPIEVDLEKWLEHLEDANVTKFDKRNIKFNSKDKNNWQLKALIAEKQLSMYKEKFNNVSALYADIQTKYSQIRDIIIGEEEYDD